MQLSPEAQAQADADAQAQADADAQDAADARAQAQADADYDKQMQQMELQQMRQQTQMQQMQVQQAQQEQQGGYADEQDYGDDEDQYADQYAVQGPAPEGLGALIGGIAGGIGGMFFGSPEIGAPLGAALGGAIQGGVEKATGGHPTGASMGGGAIQGGIGQATGGHPTGASMGRGASKTYLQGSQRVTVSGAFSPDGLFEPGPGEISALANLIAMSNSLLRKYRPGTSWTGDRRGSSAQITISAASGAFDLPRYANLGVEWIEEHFEKGADAMYDFVGGGPVARDFGPYSAATIKTILDDLHGAGLTVSGDNPYSVDANQHGIVLGATYHDSGLLTVSIVSSNFYVSHNQVWDKISPMMPAADW